MKTLSALVMAGAVACSSIASAQTQNPPFRLNSLGYLPDAPKQATIATSAATVHVVGPNGQVALTAQVVATRQDEEAGEALTLVDFSELRAPGHYRLRVKGLGESPVFRVDPELYREPFFLVTRAMHLWRCGFAVDGEWKGHRFHHQACHLDDAWLDHATGEHKRRPSTGGWHDAGDYNKYVVNAGVTVGAMLRAWEDFPAIRRVSLALPESGEALPDFLAELKWETDWLLTMQDDEGRVYTKVSTLGFGAFVLPHKETEPRYFAPWGTPATADFVAMLAQASRAFRPYLPDYADRCLAAARKSYAFLLAHPEHHEPDQSAFQTGGYGTKDADDRLWAAAEMWETTGDAAALRDVEAKIRAQDPSFEENFDWSSLKNLGLFTYLFSSRSGRDEQLVETLRTSLLQTADAIADRARTHDYARPLGNLYYWGGNGGVARQTLLLHGAYRLSNDAKYRQVALDALNHLFGRNVHGRSYVTGLGHLPPLKPHDRRSGGDRVDEPWPGYLVGGPNPKAQDWFDEEPDYRTNEFAINWNAALIYALAMFVRE